MYLYLGALAFCFCFYLFLFAYIVTRSGRKTLWNNETIMSCCITPLIVGTLSLGIAGVVQSLFPANHPSLGEVGVAGGIVVVAAVLYYLLGINKRVKALRDEKREAEIIAVDFGNGEDENPTRPSFTPPADMKKAA